MATKLLDRSGLNCSGSVPEARSQRRGPAPGRTPTVYTIDPLSDARWPELLEKHPGAGLFHSREWLKALQNTYGFRALALTTSAADEDLRDGLVFCEVRSRLTGWRLVSLPFSDHCAPLIDNDERFGCLISHLRREVDQGSEKYFELRSIATGTGPSPGLVESASYCLHRINLRPSMEELFRSFHTDCVRRKIRRAEREILTYEEGNSEPLLRKFYGLMVPTRRRQGVPPQPLSWFRNLIACLKERLKIRVVSHHGQPAAAMITIRHKSTMTYKYGCSDTHFHRLGCMQLLMWKAIQEAKTCGLQVFDMGRTDWSNDGLLAFKDRWGAKRSSLHYLRHSGAGWQQNHTGLSMRVAGGMLGWAPDRLFITAGTILYRHFA